MPMPSRIPGLMWAESGCYISHTGRGLDPPLFGYPLGNLHTEELELIVLGVILLIIGFLTGISWVWTIGLALVVIGAVLAVVGRTGTRVAGRSHWF